VWGGHKKKAGWGERSKSEKRMKKGGLRILGTGSVPKDLPPSTERALNKAKGKGKKKTQPSRGQKGVLKSPKKSFSLGAGRP